MRPEKLHMWAFGPYASEQVIDFGQLGARSLFLINGPTGAGKSSILDALCFALYGLASGDERIEAELRSQYATPDQATRVELTFTKGEARYRVERSPTQPRPKKRGGGFTERKAQATLYRQTADGGWQAMASKPSQVTAEVQALLGFEVSQFRQVVVLPQGQFRKLLSADSAQREKILASLFQTHLYRRLQEALREEYRAVDKEIKELEQEDRGMLSEGGLTDRSDLERAMAEVAGALKTSQSSLGALEKAEQAGLAQRDESQALANRFAELDGAEGALAGLEAERTSQDARVSQLKQAEKAAALDGLFEDLELRREEAQEASEALKTAHMALKGAERKSRKAIKAFERQAGRKQVRKAAQQKVLKLEGLIPLRDEWAAAQVRLDGLRAEAERASALSSERGDELAQARVELVEQGQELKVQSAQASQVAGLVAKVETAERLLDAAKRRDAGRTALRAAQNHHAQAGTQRDKLDEGLRRLRDKLDRLLREQLDGQASVLAARLERGEACPVCGSTDHPKPARSRKKIPDSAAIDARREKVLASEADLEAARDAETAAAKRVAELTAGLEQAERELGDGVALGVADLERSGAQARGALEDSRRAAERTAELTRQISDLERAIQRMDTSATRAQEAEAKAKQALAQAEGETSTKGRQIHHSYRSSGALEEATEKAKVEASSLEQALESARSQRDAATRDLTAQREHAAGCEKDCAKRAEILSRREQVFGQRLKKAGFGSEGVYHDARLDAESREALGRLVAEFNAALGEARKRLTRARKDTAGRERPQLESIEQAYAQARKALDAAREERTRLAERVASLGSKLAAMDRRAEKVAGLEARFGMVGELSEAANDKAMNFERWVLSALLDEVLAAASVRLKRMSRDRFLLRRDLDRRDRRKISGLELRVFDAHTGAERSAGSLSGGEGFMAALSLALGLADVVQAHAGGIRLDTLFVDEGFGALDPEALDQAFGTLVDLRAEGRLVGVISHVPELAARIDARLEIRPAGRGSAANWVL